MRYFRFLAVLVLAVTAAGSASATSTVPVSTTTVWSASWGTAQAQAISVGPWQQQTLRMVTRTSLGGTQARVRLANPFATSTATFGHVTVGQQLGGDTTQATPVNVTFGGSASLTLAPGASAVSDPVTLTITAGTRLLVSLYIPSGANITSAPVHQMPVETEYNYVGGDVAGAATFTATNTFGFTTYLTGVDVAAPAASTVVAVGDSITDGNGAILDADTRWPDYLAARVAPAALTVINEGISADWVTADQSGAPSVTSRWSRDVLSQPGLRTAIDEGGINDLRGGVSASTLESAQASLVSSAHAAGARILLATLTPCAGDSQCTSTFETQRVAYNAWVRGASSGADGFVDFDAAVRNGAALANAYDSGDHIHPNPAGYAVMAGAVNASAL